MTKQDINSDWMLDSRCSFHLSPNNSYFVSLKEVEYGKVLMGNNTVCKIAGIGTIKFRLHDGMMRTLSNVRYIPELKRNLISLGMLGENGYSTHIRQQMECFFW